MLRARLANGGQHRDGNRQLQRAGEIHHEYGQGLRHIPGEEPGGRRARQGVGNQLVSQMLCLALHG